MNSLHKVCASQSVFAKFLLFIDLECDTDIWLLFYLEQKFFFTPKWRKKTKQDNFEV